MRLVSVMDKLPNLIVAFGQVRAATMTNRNGVKTIPQAGVPLLQALSDQLSKTSSWNTENG